MGAGPRLLAPPHFLPAPAQVDGRSHGLHQHVHEGRACSSRCCRPRRHVAGSTSHKLASVRSRNCRHSEASNVLGASGRVIHSGSSYEVACFRATSFVCEADPACLVGCSPRRGWCRHAHVRPIHVKSWLPPGLAHKFVPCAPLCFRKAVEGSNSAGGKMQLPPDHPARAVGLRPRAELRLCHVLASQKLV